MGRSCGVATLLYPAPVPPPSNRSAVGAVAAAIAIAGCGGARGGAAGQPLTPDSTGWVDVSTTGTTGIQGPWYAVTDSTDCLGNGHPAAACSMLVTPDPAAGAFPPTADLGMCAVGVVAQVIAGPDGQPDYGHLWGAHIGFNLNDGNPYDAPAHGVTGLAFHIDSEPAEGARMQVLLATAATGYDSPLWGGATAETSPVHIGRNEIRWADVGGPTYIAEPPRFDPAQILSIQFGVKTDELAPKSFAFCISAVTALRD
jgi:hypothetical protein